MKSGKIFMLRIRRGRASLENKNHSISFFSLIHKPPGLVFSVDQLYCTGLVAAHKYSQALSELLQAKAAQGASRMRLPATSQYSSKPEISFLLCSLCQTICSSENKDRNMGEFHSLLGRGHCNKYPFQKARG